jgi:uncharacterized protein YktB (UPF0637 family)
MIDGFAKRDFDVFTIPGLEPRMAALVRHVRPKLERIGEEFAPYLSALCGQEMFPHVARHARRTVHPPDDTWVAWSHDKKGYKAHPHFQVGLWSSHVFIQFAVIYESKHKEAFAKALRAHLPAIKVEIPGQFFWSTDHTQPVTVLHSQMKDGDFERLIDRLGHVKKAEALCGLSLSRDDDTVHCGEKLHAAIGRTFEKLLPLYRLAF